VQFIPNSNPKARRRPAGTIPLQDTKRSDRPDIPGLTLPVHGSPPEVRMILVWLKWLVWLCLRRYSRHTGCTHPRPTADRRRTISDPTARPTAGDPPPPGATGPPGADVSPSGFVLS